ncbi:MAG: hypothetical protein IPK67_04570 [Planctomycetes bacterium]|nr:hypothetical protein [Planctomycetota bacterium]
MAGIEIPRDDVNRLQRTVMIIAGVAIAATAFGAFQDRQQFWHSYLLAFMFTLGFPLGSFAVVQIFHLTHGSWGHGARRFLECSMRTLPFLAVCFAPIAFLGMHSIYEWSHAEVVAGDPILTHKQPYLNPSAFQMRAVGYFAVWIVLMLIQSGLSRKLDETGDARHLKRMSQFAGPALLIYVLTMSFAAFDWTMSLDPHWFSTIYGLIFVVGQGISTWAFAIIFSNWLSKRTQFEYVMQPGHFHDLGKLMFASVLLHAYTNFSQFLIIWSGNIAEEQPFFLVRKEGPWLAIGLFLVVFHFALPFLVLLSRNLKKNAGRLVIVACWLLLLRWVDLSWYIVPSIDHEGGALGQLHWMDVAAPIALFTTWLALFLQGVKGRVIVTPRDQAIEAALEGMPAHSAPGHH